MEKRNRPQGIVGYCEELIRNGFLTSRWQKAAPLFWVLCGQPNPLKTIPPAQSCLVRGLKEGFTRRTE
jgi:hypothetical protein